MSMYGLSNSQLEQLMYPNGRGQYHYGNEPVYINQTSQPVNGALPGRVDAIGSTPVATGVVAATDPTLGVTAGQVPAAGAGAGAMPGGATGGAAGGYASVAGAAINQIAQVASDYTAAKAKAEALKSQQAVPNIPESSGAAGSFTPPALAFA